MYVYIHTPFYKNKQSKYTVSTHRREKTKLFPQPRMCQQQCTEGILCTYVS